MCACMCVYCFMFENYIFNGSDIRNTYTPFESLFKYVLPDNRIIYVHVCFQRVTTRALVTTVTHTSVIGNALRHPHNGAVRPQTCHVYVRGCHRHFISPRYCDGRKQFR